MILAVVAFTYVMVAVVEVDRQGQRGAAGPHIVQDDDRDVCPAVVHGQELGVVIVLQSKLAACADAQVIDRARPVTPTHHDLVIFQGWIRK